jgi:hypothetical protein
VNRAGFGPLRHLVEGRRAFYFSGLVLKALRDRGEVQEFMRGGGARCRDDSEDAHP